MPKQQTIVIKSRLLQRLDKDVAGAASPLRSAPLRAQRAILLARHGDLNSARAQLTELHQLAFQHSTPELGAWVQLAEGLMSFYSDLSDGAPDKVQRAKSVARAAGLREVDGLASAWLAQFAFVSHDFDALVRHARDCLDLTEAGEHSSRSRLALAVALAYDEAEVPASAKAWYAEARRHASAEGDDATLSAIMFNMTMMRITRSRYQVLSRASAGPITELLMGADSIRNYDRAVGVSSKVDLAPLLQAQLLALSGEFSQAQSLYEQHLPQALSQGLTRMGGDYLADLAWCRVNNGQPEQALQHARRAEQELDPSCHLNDRASAHSRLAQVHASLGDEAEAKRHAALAARHWQEVAGQQQRWQAVLAEAGLSNP